jgi:hypothetical protein
VLYRSRYPGHRRDINIASPSSIVNPEAAVRSRFMGHAARRAARAAAGV